jgi:hypothetical protein
MSDITYPDAHSGGLKPLNSQLFSTLSHQIESLLKKLPTFDKLDFSYLLAFLVDVIQIRNVCPMPHKQFSKLILLYSSDPLPVKFVPIIKGGWTFQHFHCEVLEYFVPLKYTKSMQGRCMRDSQLQHILIIFKTPP